MRQAVEQKRWFFRPVNSASQVGQAFVGLVSIRYNNSKIRDAREPINDINKLLYRNRTVLKDLYERFESRELDKNLLHHSDYNKRYYTHHSYNQHNELYTWCYDYGWIIVDEQRIQVVKSKG